jgi:hypothetical protein
MISVDPGVKFCGVAWWTRRGELINASLHATDALYHLESSELVIVEQPQYDARTDKVRVQDVLNLSVAAGRAAEALRSFAGKVAFYTPKAWKSELPKKICHERALAALKFGERDLIELPKNKKGRSDVMDAVALGLWWLRKNGVR